MKHLSITLLLLAGFPVLALAQGTVTGRVVALGTGQPLSAVQVGIPDTEFGAVTGPAGGFRITGVPEGTHEVRATRMGYAEAVQTVTVRTGETVTVELSLSSQAVQLEGVVAVGYGTQRKRELTGAVATVQGEQLAKLSVPSVAAALQGQAPGVQVSTPSGVPGAASRILIRGTTSISAGSEPLVVVDGFPLSQGNLTGFHGVNPLAAINSEDIESIDVLKDAAATAIYGSRGANGVILITTKTGRGAPSTTVDYRAGFSNAVNMVEMAGAQQWLRLVDLAWANDDIAGQWEPALAGGGLSSGLVSDWIPNRTTYWTRADAEALAAAGGTDWLDPIWRQGFTQDLNVSTSRGFDRGAFYISGNYHGNEGLVENQSLSRMSLRANVDFEPFDRLSTGVRTNLSYIENNLVPLGGSGPADFRGGRPDRGVRGAFGTALTGVPILPIRLDDGEFFDPLGGRNVVVGLDPDNFRNYSDQYRGIVNGFGELDILDGLSLRGQAAVDFWQASEKHVASDVIRVSKYAELDERRDINYNINSVLNYDRYFGDHHFDGILGAERQITESFGSHSRAENLTSADEFLGNPRPDDIIVLSQGDSREFHIQSYFGRINYAFKDRYLLSASLRRDGASVFGRLNRWGTFPAFSAGWVVSDEDFAQNWGPINFLKLRGSYGQTGNADIPFVLDDRFTTWPQYGPVGAVTVQGIGVPDIGWEDTKTIDGGFEFGLFDNRVSGSLGYYRQDVDEMLLEVPIPLSQGIMTGGLSVWTNIGALRNQGLEGQLSTINLELDNGFSWRSDFNFGTVDNEILRLSPRIEDNPLGINVREEGIRTVTIPGGEIGTFYMAEAAGIDPETGNLLIWEMDQELFRSEGITRRTGEKILATSGAVSSNRMILDGKSGLPSWYGGFTNSFGFGGLELSTLFTFQGGNYIYNDFGQTISDQRNFRADLEDRVWTPENRDAELPRVTFLGKTATGENVSSGGETTLFLEKGDYLRLRNLQLSYQLPESISGRFSAGATRLYVNGTNLFTWTGYSGFDPEVVRFDSDRQTRNLTQGILGAHPFPQVRTWTLGAQVSF